MLLSTSYNQAYISLHPCLLTYIIPLSHTSLLRLHCQLLVLLTFNCAGLEIHNSENSISLFHYSQAVRCFFLCWIFYQKMTVQKRKVFCENYFWNKLRKMFKYVKTFHSDLCGTKQFNPLFWNYFSFQDFLYLIFINSFKEKLPQSAIY